MLVVITIILAISALAYAVFPKQSDRKMTYGADRLQAWLLSAKQQAKRDQRATGLRLIPNAAGINTLIYVQQLDDFAPPDPATGLPSTCTCAGTALVTFNQAGILLGNFAAGGQIQGNAQTGGDLAPVSSGDYIEFYRGGSVYQIASVAASGTTLTLTGNGPITGAAASYRIIRQPRPLMGQEDLTLPDDIIIDFTNVPSGSTPKSVVPTRAVLDSTTSVPTLFSEIVFGPAGNVIGQNSGQDKVYLWLTDSTGVAQPLILALQVRTGLVGVHPVGSAGNEYQFAKDGRSSGM